MDFHPARTFSRTREGPESPPAFLQAGFRPGGMEPQLPQQQQNNNDRQQRKQPLNEDEKPSSLRVTAWDAEVFGQEIHDQFKTLLQPPRSQAPRSYVPSTYSVDELFLEDEQHSANYATTIGDEDALAIQGLDGELVTLDKWTDIDFPESLMKNIQRANYIKPREIQKSAIPLILDCYDIIGHAQTGSGKTAAYLIPIIAECIEAKAKGTFESNPAYPYCIILAPTRELVRQCFEQASKFAHETGVTVAKAYGEYPTRRNMQEINQGCDILCTSPGRFKHFCDEGCISFSKLRFLVFDEGDELLAPFFFDEIRPIMQLPSFPQGNLRQTLFFSATFSDDLIATAKEFMRPAPYCVVISNHKNIVNKKCEQDFVAPEPNKKFTVLVDFLKNELDKAGNDLTKFPRTLVFANTRDYCEKIATALTYSGIPSKPLSGLRAQDLREKAFDEFRGNKISVLIASDIGARGIDIKELDLVIMFDMPDDYETYIHRAGRVGRIRYGKCLSFVTFEKNKELLLQIKKAMEESGQIIPPSLEEMLRPKGIKKELRGDETSSVTNGADKVEDVAATAGFSGNAEEKERGIDGADTVAAADGGEDVNVVAPSEEEKTQSEVPAESVC